MTLICSLHPFCQSLNSFSLVGVQANTIVVFCFRSLPFCVSNLHYTPKFFSSVYKTSDLFNGVQLEEGITQDAFSKLYSLGHNPVIVAGLGRAVFGRGQIISRGPWWQDGLEKQTSNLYWAGSDPRADGLVAAY